MHLPRRTRCTSDHHGQNSPDLSVPARDVSSPPPREGLEPLEGVARRWPRRARRRAASSSCDSVSTRVTWNERSRASQESCLCAQKAATCAVCPTHHRARRGRISRYRRRHAARSSPASPTRRPGRATQGGGGDRREAARLRMWRQVRGQRSSRSRQPPSSGQKTAPVWTEAPDTLERDPELVSGRSWMRHGRSVRCGRRSSTRRAAGSAPARWKRPRSVRRSRRDHRCRRARPPRGAAPASHRGEPPRGVITTPRLKEKVGQHVTKGELIAKCTTATRQRGVEISRRNLDVRSVTGLLKARAYPRGVRRGVTSIAPIATREEGRPGERSAS